MAALRQERAKFKTACERLIKQVATLNKDIAVLNRRSLSQERITAILRQQRAAQKSAQDLQNNAQKQNISRLNSLATQITILEEQASLVNAIARGDSFETAVLSFVRTMSAGRNRIVARSFAQRLLNERQARRLGLLACGIYYHVDNFPQTALRYFERANRDQVRKLCPIEYFSSAMATDPAERGGASSMNI